MIPAHLLNHTGELYRPEKVPNGSGGWTDELVSQGTFKCRVRSQTTEEQLIARQSGVSISHVAYTRPDLDVQRGDVVEARGITLDVTAVRRPSVVGHHLVVDLEERQT